LQRKASDMEEAMNEKSMSCVAVPLSGRSVLVTGGGGGLGQRFAETLARNGASVVICGRRPEPLERVGEVIRSAGGFVTVIPADVTREEDLQRLVESAGPIDILVNNAGYSLRAPWAEVSLED
jgi:NAD(P)-dependent dehydrogenase (short-subunit alcohol dehydrogenase family)